MRVAFGKERIDPIEFKDRWRYVVEEQNDFIYRLASMRKSREIMSFLSEIRGKEWEERLSLYNQLKQEIISRRQPIEKNWQMVREMKERLREIKDPVERRTIREQLRRLRDDTWKMEKSEEIKRLREALKTLEIESERAKAEILRYSYLVKENLPYTNCRPSAWWFIAMDPSRRWFKSIVESLKIYTEGERCRDYNLQRCIQ